MKWIKKNGRGQFTSLSAAHYVNTKIWHDKSRVSFFVIFSVLLIEGDFILKIVSFKFQVTPIDELSVIDLCSVNYTV